MGKMLRKKSKIGNFRVLNHIMNKRIASTIVFVFKFAYLSNFKEIKIIIFQKKPTKTLMHISNWEFYASSLGKKYIFCHWECLLLSVVSI